MVGWGEVYANRPLPFECVNAEVSTLTAGDGHSFIDRVAATEHPGMGVLLLKLIELTREQNEMIRWIMMDQHRRNMAEGVGSQIPQQASGG